MDNQDNKITVLVVDDSDIIRNSLRNFFSEYNLDVITCLNGLEGIQKAIEHKPCLIILDLLMPNFDGIKMLQVIKVIEDLKRIPVIVISGNTNRSNVLASLEAGADRVISKPLQKDVIIKNINEVLGKEFLLEAKKNNYVPEIDQNEMLTQFRKFFLNSFPMKKNAIASAVSAKNKVRLKSVVHEIKGSGSTIGYPELSKIAGEIEFNIDNLAVDWDVLKLKCEEIFSIVKEIENVKPILDK